MNKNKKIIISEKQLSLLIDRTMEMMEQEEAPASTTDENPETPEVGKWESGVTRGPANQISPTSKWSEVVGAQLKRGKANPLK